MSKYTNNLVISERGNKNDLKSKNKRCNWKSVLVTTTWNINEDELVRFGKVLIRATSKLPFKKIMREIVIVITLSCFQRPVFQI